MIEKIKANALTLLLVGMVVLGGVVMLSQGGGAGTTVDVKVPNLTALALEGEQLFDDNCASCHGKNAGGTDKAPPLVHTTYNPGHHADEAFLRAVKDGVRAHHWKFGNMPPLETPKTDVLKIVRYVRELQRANGINYKPHNM